MDIDNFELTVQGKVANGTASTLVIEVNDRRNRMISIIFDNNCMGITKYLGVQKVLLAWHIQGQFCLCEYIIYLHLKLNLL